jgi:transposase
MLPQASVSPAARRATRDRLRRRLHLTRQRAAWLAHLQNTPSPYNRPESGKKLASQANRDGVAARAPDPAVQKSVDVDLALIDSDERLLNDVALTLVQTAKQPKAPTLYRLQSVPGIGKLLRVGLLSAMPDITRFPRVQELVSYGRLVKCAKESAGKRYGTSGTKIGHAYLQWAFSEAAVLLLRNNAKGQLLLARLDKRHGKGKALTILAHELARAVYDMLRRDTVFARDKFLTSGSRAGEPGVSLDPYGSSLYDVLRILENHCVRERAEGPRCDSLSLCD